MYFRALGALYIVESPDYLLFLLVVLASGWGLRQVQVAGTSLAAVIALGIARLYGRSNRRSPMHRPRSS